MNLANARVVLGAAALSEQTSDALIQVNGCLGQWDDGAALSPVMLSGIGAKISGLGGAFDEQVPTSPRSARDKA